MRIKILSDSTSLNEIKYIYAGTKLKKHKNMKSIHKRIRRQQISIAINNKLIRDCSDSVKFNLTVYDCVATVFLSLYTKVKMEIVDTHTTIIVRLHWKHYLVTGSLNRRSKLE